MITESGTHSVTYRNALAYAKRNARKEKYCFDDTVTDAKYKYYLNEEEATALNNALRTYCKKNYLYLSEI